jgi:sigma-B regulation protein RsbU (phosphoserine phosphatase)
MLVVLALGVAAVAFERAARNVVIEAVHSHLQARAKEVHESVTRFQRERALTVRNWAETEAMQLTLDSKDPKFAEDYLRRTVQDQGGAISAAALVDDRGRVVAAVRAAAPEERRAVPLQGLRGARLDPKLLAEAADAVEVEVVLTQHGIIDPEQGSGDTLLFIAPIRDFASDLVGYVAATLAPQSLSQLLDEVNGRGTNYRPVIADRARRMVLSLPGSPAAVPWPDQPSLGAAGQLERFAAAGAEPLFGVRTTPDDGVPGWSALMLVPQREAEGRLHRLRALLGALFAAVLVGAVVAATFALRQASRPLADVARSMTRVAGGDLTTRVADEYADELGHLVRSFNTMVSEVERSRDELQRTEALRREVQIAHRIQTAILPVSPAVPGFEVAARMKPAEDVGGDLYDILAFDDGFWVLIGDVSGHGINSGLVMMMAQVAAYGAIADDPRCSPRDVVAAVNRVVHENVRRRMGRDDYLTLMVARHGGDGRFVAAGAHQPVFVARADGRVEVVEPVGPWCGITPEVDGRLQEFEFGVAPGELLCLVTDGILEAQDTRGDLFGDGRLAATLAATGGMSASEALATVFTRVEGHASTQADDMTAVVLRRKNE